MQKKGCVLGQGKSPSFCPWHAAVLLIFSASQLAMWYSNGWDLEELPVLQVYKWRPYRGAVQHAVLIWQRSLSSMFPEVPCTCIRNIPWTPLKNSTVLYYAFSCSIFCHRNSYLYCCDLLIAKVVMVAPATLDSIQSRAARSWTLLMVAKGGLSQGKPLLFPLRVLMRLQSKVLLRLEAAGIKQDHCHDAVVTAWMLCSGSRSRDL